LPHYCSLMAITYLL